MKSDKFSINNNKLLSFLLSIIDFFIPIFFKKYNLHLADVNSLMVGRLHPNKILISNIAHLGDVILSTSILKVLKSEYPNSKIYFLCGSWSSDILKDHPLIDEIFTFDHFKLNRSNVSFFRKLLIHFKTEKRAIDQIRKANISIGIDLRLHFPNSSSLLYKGQIPLRFGYSSGGFSRLFTSSLDYKQNNQHITKDYIDLLNIFLKNKIQDDQLPPYMYLKDSSLDQRGILNNIPEDYYIIHIGAGLNSKMLNLQKWKELKEILLSKKINLVFSGNGKIEAEIINELIFNNRACINLCNKLSFNEFLSVVKNAKKVICVDTSIIHIATSFDIPLVIFYSKINNHHNWVLKNKNIKIIEFDGSDYDKINLETIDF